MSDSTSSYDSAAVDIKIDIRDQAGNTSEWVMEPAYCVGKYGTITGVKGNAPDNTAPKTFSLYQNYPNPFNPSTIISYDVPRRTMVQLSVYNILGQARCDAGQRGTGYGTLQGFLGWQRSSRRASGKWIVFLPNAGG